jgi:hypothetical protein
MKTLATVVVLALGWFGLGECSKKTNASAATIAIEGIFAAFLQQTSPV